MIDQLHTIGTIAATIMAAAAFGELPLLCALLNHYGAWAPYH
jgi:hypothetical protein